MSVIKSLKNRKCVRKFLEKEIPQETMQQLLDAVRWTPSTKNTQTWKIAVVSGHTKDKITSKLVQACKDRQKPLMEYDYEVEMFQEELFDRAVQCGMDLYGALGIERDDKENRIKQWQKNYEAFGAPTAIFLFKYKSDNLSTYLDAGMMLQSILLAADDLGLGACPQASLAQYPEIVKNEIGFNNYTLVCGIAIGYEDKSDKVNNYRTKREKIEDFVTFFK